MKEERLLKKIEDQAKKFKARALKSPEDGKRHDLVRQDEKKCMSTAHHQLGWSFARIGSVFDRDPRTAKQAVESYAARKQWAGVVSEQIGRHFDKLASLSEVLAHHVARLLRFKDDNNIKSWGFPPSFWTKTTGQPVIEDVDPLAEFTYQEEHPIDLFLAKCLHAHCTHQFGELPFESWDEMTRENVSQKILDNLKLLAYGGLKYCPTCPICKEIADRQ